MGRIALNLKDFEYVKHDKHTTTLKHKKAGHELKIAHKALSKDAQAQLSALHQNVDAQSKPRPEALSKISEMSQTPEQANAQPVNQPTMMADGGEAEDPQEQNPSPEEQWQQIHQGKSKQDYASDVAKGSQQSESISEGWKNVKSALGLAEGGKVDKKAEVRVEVTPKPEENTLNYKDLKKEKKEMNVAEARKPVKGRRFYAEGTPDQPVQPEAGPQPEATTQPDQPNIPPSMLINSQNDPVAGKASSQIFGTPDPSLISQQYNKIVGSSLDPDPATRPTEKMFGPNGEPPKNFDPNAWVQAQNLVANQHQALKQQDMQQAENITRVNQIRQQAGLPPLPNMELPQTPEDNLKMADATASPTPPSREPQSMPAAPSPTGASGMPQNFDQLGQMMYGGYQKGVAGLSQQAKVEGQIGQEQTKALDAQVQNQQTALGEYQKQVDALNTERAGFIKDLQNQHIDPNAYWKDHSKLMTGIGLVLGGMGSGLTGGPNQAMQLLQYQMNNNMKAQQAEMDKKNNLLKFNYMQYGNMKDALDATRIMQNDIVVHQLQSAAARNAAPMAKARALQAIGQLQTQTANIMQPFVMRRMMLSLVNNGQHGAAQATLNYLRVMNPELYKDYASRYIPGYNKFADIPIDDKARQEVVAKDSLAAGLKDLKDFAQQHTGSLNPQIISEGRTKAMYLQQLLREGMNMGVYREYDQPLMNKLMTDDPTKFMNDLTTIPKLKSLIHQNDLSRRVLLSRYGLPYMPTESSQDPNAMLQWAMKNPKDPRAMRIMQHFKQQGQQP